MTDPAYNLDSKNIGMQNTKNVNKNKTFKYASNTVQKR